MPPSIKNIEDNYDWQHIFENYTEGAQIEDIRRVIAYSDGENDGAEWVGFFELRDGRFMYTVAGCDYTGWGCQESGRSEFFGTELEALRNLPVSDVGRMGDHNPKFRKKWADAVKEPPKKAHPSDVPSVGPRRRTMDLDE